MAKKRLRKKSKSGSKSSGTRQKHTEGVRKPAQLVARTTEIFWPDHLDHVKAIAMRGLTDDEMASFLGISEELMQSWKAYYPTFEKAINEGRTHADAQVVAALHANAIGYEYETDFVVRTRRGAEVVTAKVRHPGETAAQKFWLQNRDRANWNAATPLSISTPKGEAVRIRDETKEDIINSLLNLVQPQPDGPSSPD